MKAAPPHTGHVQVNPRSGLVCLDAWPRQGGRFSIKFLPDRARELAAELIAVADEVERET